ITPETKLISLTHPNNPSGSIISKETLDQVVQLAEEHNVYVLFDETYRELAFEEILPSAASLSPKMISISSMSKCYGLPGIRTGWMASQTDEIIDSVLAVREQLSITNGAVSEEIAFNVLQRKHEFLQRAKDHVRKNLDLVVSWMKQQKDITWVPPEAGVVALPRIETGEIDDPETVYRILAEKYRSFVVPGRCFEMDNAYFRIGFGGTADELQAGLSNIVKAINDVKNG
ncbi:aminotransferase class I/II-fold pyridoxal phosphate-dependent enzyme, partial [candidate division KSB1 bacterium]